MVGCRPGLAVAADDTLVKGRAEHLQHTRVDAHGRRVGGKSTGTACGAGMVGAGILVVDVDGTGTLLRHDVGDEAALLIHVGQGAVVHGQLAKAADALQTEGRIAGILLGYQLAQRTQSVCVLHLKYLVDEGIQIGLPCSVDVGNSHSKIPPLL